MSNRVFDDSENKNSIKPFNKNSQNENTHISNKGSTFRQMSRFKRVPLGGKDQNTNTFELNRSKSTINPNLNSLKSNSKPPSLVKSNSSLGFQSVPVFQEFTQEQRSQLQSTEPQVANIGSKQVEDQSSRNLISIPKPNRSVRKRVSLDELSLPTLLSPKKPKLFQTDSLIKSDGTQHKPPIPLRSTFSERTEALNSRHVVNNDITRNNVDPIKRPNRRHSIDAMVAQHWRDEIEFVPHGYNEKEADSLVSFNDNEVQFFSTPNVSHDFEQPDEDLNLELDFENDTGNEELDAEVTIDGNEKDDFGLNDEDLRNLLD
ncbi:hypothetical protein CANMA_002783 [Candida margitis]|uniref:uncharacterized protein n=1 Tax=Candida margitis TaxID=1775924 RepID=UPI0022261DA4|nr:uncharacterized protein CANMA_002783 [Candida margitis]KAI5968015.1 hypothetical protein CANMA_002783 [Candida margitis]